MHPLEPSATSRPWRRSAPAGGSVIVVVLVALMFAAAALIVFIEKAGNDLLMETREADAARLRREAQSALETTLAVLEEFRQVQGALRSPAEGWGDPLEFAGYESLSGAVVRVRFEDESGKLSLPTMDGPALVELFKSWEVREADAERLADALLGWMQPDYVPKTAGAPASEDYDRGDTPYQPPGRPLRSFSELAAIGVANEFFYDAAGRPNANWHRFRETVSLYRYPAPNLNAAAPGALAALSRFDDGQQRRFAEYLRGSGPYARRGPGFFRTADEALAVAGGQASLAGWGVEVRALRIRVFVERGGSRYELAALVSPPNGAEPVLPVEIRKRDGRRTDAAAPAPASAPPPPAASRGNRKTLNYPFTLLEMTENVVLSAEHAPDTTL